MLTRTLSFIVLFAVFVAAQTKYPVSGKLTNAVNGEPVRKAKISLHPEDPAKTVYNVSTDAEGRFRFENIEPGRYTLQGEKPGFVEGWYGSSHAEGPGGVIEVGKNTPDLAFKLTPQGVVAGRVLDDEGEPVSGVTVMPTRYMYVSGHKRLMPVLSGMPIQTNDLGEYRLSNLPPGRYYIHSDAQKMMDFAAGMEKPQDDKPQEVLIPVYFPNAPDAASASAVEVGPGAEVRGIDLRLKRVRAQNVTGKVVDASGKPIATGMLMLYRDDPGAMSLMPSGMSMLKGDSGEFEMRGVAPGAYRVMSMSMSDPTHMTMAGKFDVVDQPVRDLVMRAGGAGDLPVTVKLNGDAKSDASGMHLMLQVDGNPLASMTNTQIAKDGTGVLKQVSPDHYKIQTFGLPPDRYLKSARLGSADVLDAGLDLRSGVAGTLELTLDSPAAQLSGTVKNDDDKLVPGATVTLIAKDPRWRTDMAHSTTTDQNGHFVFAGLVPAEYRVYAWQEIEEGAAEDEEFRKPFEKFRTEVDLRTPLKAPVELKLIPKQELPARSESK
jgi:protocatechuate 3,4-dioxygenase beta subunit